MYYSIRLFRGLVGKITTGYDERVMYGLYREDLELPLIVSLSESEITVMRDLLAPTSEAGMSTVKRLDVPVEKLLTLTEAA